jgi:thymidine kinase
MLLPLSSIYKPGYLEVIFGPMKSGKSEYLIHLFNEFSYSSLKTVAFKPIVDTRTTDISTRTGDKRLDAVAIDENTPEDIFTYLETSECKIIGIDEAQFFSDRLVDVVMSLLKQNYHVIISGLLLNFRGEPFGPMPYLIGRANNVIRLTAVCDYPHCNNWAVLTQRLIDGKPASYDSPLVLIEGSGQRESYEARCVIHHNVPTETKEP